MEQQINEIDFSKDLEFINSNKEMNDINYIAYCLNKSTQTINNYLNGTSKEPIILKAIIEKAYEALSKRGISSVN